MIIGDTPTQLGQIEAADAMMIDGKIVTRDDYRALKAQVSTLLDELNASVIAILARNPPDEIHAIACCMAEAAKATPQQHLAEIRAQAVIDAVVSHEVRYGNSQFGRHLREYADCIRKEAK